MLKNNKLEIIGLILFLLGFSIVITLTFLYLVDNAFDISLLICSGIIIIGYIFCLIENHREKVRKRKEIALRIHLKKLKDLNLNNELENKNYEN